MKSFIIKNKFDNFFKDVEEFPAVRLDNEAFPTTFNPSAGETHLYKIFKEKTFKKTIKFRVCQPCIRIVDIDKSATTPFHKSFFEMLAVFFAIPNNNHEDLLQIKKWICKSNLDFLTKELGLNKEDLFYTVFDGATIFNEDLPPDEETHNILKEIGINKVIRVKGLDNLIYHDPEDYESKPIYDINSYVGPRVEVFLRLKKGERFDAESPSFVEISTFGFEDKWINRDKKNKSFSLIPSKYQIGFMAFGLERLEMISQKKSSIFDISEYNKIIRFIDKNSTNKIKIHINKLVDYLSGVLFVSSEGFLPGKEGKPHVLRKIIRKSILSSLLLGMKKENILSVLNNSLEYLKGLYQPRYNYLDVDVTKKIFEEEFIRYMGVIQKGIRRLDKMILEVGIDQLAKEDLTKLSNTFGLPFEIIKMRISQARLPTTE